MNYMYLPVVCVEYSQSKVGRRIHNLRGRYKNTPLQKQSSLASRNQLLGVLKLLG